MKLNLSARDMEIVGFSFNRFGIVGKDCYVEPINGLYPTPIFRKTAREYKLVCSVCGEALAN